MHPTGKMHRALGVDRIPAGRISGAEELGIKADLSDYIDNRNTDHPLGRIPSRAAGRSPQHDHLGDQPVFDHYLKFGGTKTLAIGTETILPRQSTSGRGCHDQFSNPLLAGRYDRDPLFHAH